MPIISTILGIAAVAASGVGIAEQSKSQGIQQKGETDQNKIAEQQMADKQKTYDAANVFYTPYTKTGSPFLAQQQTASADTNATNTNAAAGTFRSEMGSSGLGFGPSGSTASGLAKIGSDSATTAGSNYLQNLLANEQIKFQAENGLIEAGKMAGAPQNQPSVSTQIPAGSTTGAIGAAGQTLAGVNPTSSGNNSSGFSVPTPANIEPTMIPSSSVLTPPGTQGWNL